MGIFAKVGLNWLVIMSIHLIHGFVASPLDSNVDHGVVQGSTHVELQREVVDPLKEIKEKYEMSFLKFQIQAYFKSAI